MASAAGRESLPGPSMRGALVLPAAGDERPEADDNGHRHAYRERKRDARTVDDQRNRPETCKYHDNARQRAPRKAARAAMSRASAVRSSGRERRRHEGRTVAAASATNAVAMSHGWAAKRLLA